MLTGRKPTTRLCSTGFLIALPGGSQLLAAVTEARRDVPGRSTWVAGLACLHTAYAYRVSIGSTVWTTPLPCSSVALREGRIDEAFLRDLNEGMEMGSERYDMLASTGTFTHGHVGAGCLPELMKLLVPGRVSDLYGAPRCLG